VTSPRARIENLAAAARRDPRNLQGLLELARLVERAGAPGDLADPPLVEAVGTTLWRHPDQRPLAHLLLRLLGLAPLEDPDARVPEGFPGSTAVAQGEAYEVASGLPLRMTLPGRELVLRWVPAGPVRSPRVNRFGLGTVHVPGFLTAEAPVSVGLLQDFLQRSGRRVPAEWSDQARSPNRAARAITPALAEALAKDLGLRLLGEAEWCRLAMGPRAAPVLQLAADEEEGSQGWLDLQGLAGFGWEWVESGGGGANTLAHAGMRYRGRGSPTRGAPGPASILRTAVPDAARPWREFRVRLARDLFPAPLAGAWRAPAAPALPADLRLDTPMAGLPAPAKPDGPAPEVLAERPPLLHPGGADQLLWLEDPAWLASAGAHGVRLWARDTGEPISTPAPFAHARAPLAATSGRLYTGLAAGGLAEWTLPELALARTMSPELGLLDDVVPSGKELLVLDARGRLTSLDMQSGETAGVRPLSRLPEERGHILGEGQRVFFTGPTQLRCAGAPLPPEEDLGQTPRVLGSVALRRDRREWLLGWSTQGRRPELRRGGAGRGLDSELDRQLRPLEVRRPLALDPTGEEALLVAGPGVCRVDLEGTQVRGALEVPGGVRAAAYASPAGEVAVASDPGPLLFWPAGASAPRLPASEPRPPAACLHLADGGQAAWSFHPGQAAPLRRWGEAPAEARLPPEPDAPPMPRVTLAPSFRGGDLVVLSGSGRVHVLHARTLALRESWSAQVGVARAVSWDERRQRLLVIGIDRVALWQRDEAVAAWELWDEGRAAGPAALARNGRSLAHASGRKLRLGRVEGSRLQWAERRTPSEVRWLATAADGTATAAWLADGTLSIFQGARPAGRVKPPELDDTLYPLRHQQTVSANPLAVGPKAAWVARGLADGSVEVIDLRKRSALRRSHDHDGPVLWLATDPRGEFLASAGADGAIHLRRLD
jgi:hypothetical protein